MIHRVAALALVLVLGFASWSSLAAAEPTGADSAGVAHFLARADEAFEARQFALQESLATRALSLLEAQPSPDPVQLARAQIALGRSLAGRSLYGDPRTIASAERAVALVEGAAPEHDLVRADAQALLASILIELRRPDEALGHAHQALELRRARLGNDSDPVAQSLQVVGKSHERSGEPDSARVAFSEAIAIRERFDLSRDTALAFLLSDLARVEEWDDHPDEARAHTDAALRELDEDPSVPPDLATIQILLRYASLEFNSGDFARSVDYSRRALEIAGHRPDMDPMNVAVIRSTMAGTLMQLGDDVSACALLQESIPVFEERVGPAHTRSITFRYHLANSMAALGDTAGALAQLSSIRTALENDSTSADTGVLAEATTFEGHLMVRRDPARALALAQQAEALERSRHVPSLEAVVIARALSMTAHARLGEWADVDRATRDLESMIDSSKVFGPLTEIDVRIQQSDAALWRGRSEEAFGHALDASQLARQMLLQNVRILSDREGLRFSAHRSGALTQLLGLASSSNASTAATAWDELVRWRGVVGAEIRSRRPPRAAESDSSAMQAHAQWMRTKLALARSDVRVASGAASPEDGALHEALRAEADAAERRWAKAAPRDGSARDATTVGLADVRAALPAGAALVSFGIAGAGDDPAHIVAFIARGDEPDAPVRVLELGPVEAIEDALDRWLVRAGRSPRGDADAGRACRAEGTKVRALTWDVIAPELSKSKDVYLVPEGPLQELPWGALPEGERGYRIEAEPAFHVLDAERDLLEREDPIDGGAFLAVGGVDFDHARSLDEPPAATRDAQAPVLLASSRAAIGDCAGRAMRSLTALPGTEREVRAIEARWSEGHLLTAADATEAAFKSLAPGTAVIHLATHGIVLDDSCETTTPRTRGVGGVAPVDEAPAPKRKKTPSPWLGRRTFLALAGANAAAAYDRDENEGWLTAEEVSTLDLRGAEWVVLSACRSGIANVWRSEGVLGMQRAFRLAGARSTIASHWDVDDDATQEWMDALYAARAEGSRSVALAAQLASRTVLAARRTGGRSTHPFYWGAFTTRGE